MASSPRRCPGGCSPEPSQRVIPYTSQYPESSRPRRKVYVPAWLQATEPTLGNPLGVELPSGEYQAWSFSIPLGEHGQEGYYETDSDEDYEEEMQNVSYEEVGPAPRVYYYPAVMRTRSPPQVSYVPRRVPQAAFTPGLYAVPIVVGSDEEDKEEEEQEEEKPECCRMRPPNQPCIRPLVPGSFTDRTRRRIQEYEAEEEKPECCRMRPPNQPCIRPLVPGSFTDRTRRRIREYEAEEAKPACCRTRPATRPVVPGSFTQRIRQRIRDNYPDL